MYKVHGITLSSSLGWTTIYVKILCFLIYITWSSSLGWTIEANNIMKSSKLFWRRFDLLFYLFKIQSLTKKQKHL